MAMVAQCVVAQSLAKGVVLDGESLEPVVGATISNAQNGKVLHT